MSKDTFPSADGQDPGDYDTDGSGNRKATLVAGGVAAALVIGAAGYFLLGSGTPSAVPSAFVPAPRAAATAPKAAAPTVRKLPAAYQQRLGRDPFKALYVVPAAAPVAAVAAAPAVPTGSTPTGSTPTGSTPTGSTSTSTSPTGTTTGSTRYALKLLAISTPRPGEVRLSSWQVAGVKQTVYPGQRFGKYGELVVLAYGKTATGAIDRVLIQVGDDSPMDVRLGETVSVL